MRAIHENVIDSAVTGGLIKSAGITRAKNRHLAATLSKVTGK